MSPKHKLDETETDEARQVYLRDGRTLTLSDSGVDELVEIRSASGILELRVLLTDAGPVLQMESVRLQLRATEAVEIESKRVEIKATEVMSIATTELEVTADADVKVDAKGDVRINGKMIFLN